MSIYSFEEIHANTIFSKVLEGFVWHGKGTYVDTITRDMLDELFTRWCYVKGDMRVNFVHPATGETVTWAVDEDAPVMAIARDLGATWNTGDNVRYLGSPSAGYSIHDPKEWISDAAADIVEGADANGAYVATAVMLGAGAHCAVSVQIPAATVAGFETAHYLSFVTGTKVPTTCVRGRTAMVCDNTIEAGLMEGVRVKHTKHSYAAIVNYRETIARFVDNVNTVDSSSWIDLFANTTCTFDQYKSMVDAWCPLPNGTATSTAEKRALAMRENMRAELFRFWSDESETRVSPWHGTALGAFQALHTFEEHASRLRGNGNVNDEESLRASRHLARRFFASPVDNKGKDSTMATRVRSLITNTLELASV